MFGRDIIEEEK